MAILTDEGRAARRRYKRQWDLNHKEHNKNYIANYWNRKAAEQQQIEFKMKEVEN